MAKKKVDNRLIIGGILIALIIYLLGRKGGIKAGKRKGRVVAEYDENSVSPNFSADATALKVWNAFRGWNILDNGRSQALEDLKRLSNAELAATYNTFNEKFVEAPESMTSFIKSDFMGLFEGLQTEVVNRLERLGLT